MEFQLNRMADALLNAIASDAPRQTMKDVATELHSLARTVDDSDDSRSRALDLADQIEHHQYGLRGFGDGGLSRGRDLSALERETITKALRAYGKQETPQGIQPAWK